MEWLFDGVGGAALLALIGFFYHRFHSSKEMKSAQPISSASLDASTNDKSVAVGGRSSMQSSPVVYGSHNTINIAHAVREAKARAGAESALEGEEREEARFPWGDVLSVVIGIPACFCFVGGLIWVILHLGTVRGILQGNRTASTIAYQYGKGISPGNGRTGDQATGCGQGGIVCLGESSIPGKPISLLEEDGGNWSRIAVIVNYQEDGDSSRVIISTKSDNIALNYADHRDGSINKKLEFEMDDVKAISTTQQSYWFPVDIMYGKAGITFPITVTVKEDQRRPHTVTATFEIPVKQAASEPNKSAKYRSSSLNANSRSREITVAERVEAIIAQTLYVNRDQVKPEADFEIDLGASPDEVSLIFSNLEEEYGITIPKTDSLRIRTPGETIKYIEARVGQVTRSKP